MFNPFDSSRAMSLSGPGIDYVPVTPDDSATLSQMAISLYVETGGAVRFRSAAGQDRIVQLPDAGWILCGVSTVYATGTTATGLHAVMLSA